MPLTFDFPLEKLQTYNGISPRPSDYDQYWTQALDDMRACDPRIELVPADFHAPGAECFHMYFTGTGGARVHAKLLRPIKPQGRGPALLMFHGYTADSGDWVDKLGYVGQGFTVAAMDCRGQGGLSEDTGGVSGNTQHGHIIRGLEDALAGHPEKLLYRQIFLDTAQLAGLVMEMPNVDPARVGATGGSQGGALTIVCAALEPRVKRAAPVFPFLSDYKRIWEMDEAVNAYGELKEYFRHFDPTHARQEAIFENLGYIDIQHLASRVRAEICWPIGFMDQICPPSTQFAAYNKIDSKKSMVVYPDFGHEALPGVNDTIFDFMMGL